MYAPHDFSAVSDFRKAGVERLTLTITRESAVINSLLQKIMTARL